MSKQDTPVYQGKSGEALKRKEGIFSFHYFFYNYGRFHENCVNNVIHMIFVPVLLFSGMIALYHVTTWRDEPLPENPLIKRFNYFDIYIFLLWIVIALTFIAWSLSLMCAAHWMFENKDMFALEVAGTTYSLCYIATCVHIFGWLTQFYGHAIHEGRAPALITNLMFANFAFFFVTFEFLNNLFSYGEGPKLEEVRKFIHEDIEEYHNCKSAKTKVK
jgi:uncharacterized membrane protein YGL010W